jgi:hypothetical protein
MSFVLRTEEDFAGGTNGNDTPANFYPGRLRLNITYIEPYKSAPFTFPPNAFNLLCITTKDAANVPAIGAPRITCIDVVEGDVIATMSDSTTTFLGQLPPLNVHSFIVDMEAYAGLANLAFPAVSSTEITFNVGGNLYGCAIQAILLAPSAGSPTIAVPSGSNSDVPQASSGLLKVRARPIVRELGFFANRQAARPEIGTEPVYNAFDVEECRIRCWQSRVCEGFNFQETTFKFNSSTVLTPSRCALFDYGPRVKYADAPLANLATYFDNLSTFFIRVDALHEYRLLPNSAGWPISQLLSQSCTSAAQASVACLYSVAGCRSFDFEPSTGKCAFFSYRALSDRRVRHVAGSTHYDLDPLDLRVWESMDQPRQSTKARWLASSKCSPLTITASSDPTCSAIFDVAVEEASPFGEFAGGISRRWQFSDTLLRKKDPGIFFQQSFRCIV